MSVISKDTTFLGYRRENGRVGVRNHVIILPVDDLANAACEAVANNVKGTLAIPHPYGRLQFGADLDLHFRTMIGTGANPNVAACIVIGIEPGWTQKIVEGIAATGKPVAGFWIEGNGDIAVATTWERKVKPGIKAEEVEQILKMVATERNMRDVGTLPLSKELEARSGKKEKLLTIYSFCSPQIARRMADFSPAMAAYMPCRITLLEKEDGLWLYTLNMDMMLKLGRTLPPGLQEEAQSVRDTLHQKLERASKGEI